MKPHFVKPYQDETFEGYVSRVAADLGYSSPSWLLKEVGVIGSRKLMPKDVVAFSEHYGLDNAQLLDMYQYKSLVDGEALGNFRRSSECVICPVCFSDNQYFKQAWVHSLVTACPAHNVQLVSCQDISSYFDGDVTPFMCLGAEFDWSQIPTTSATAAQCLLAEILCNPDKLKKNFSMLVKNDQVPSRFSEFLIVMSELATGKLDRKNKQLNFSRGVEIADDIYGYLKDFRKLFHKCVTDRIVAANERASGGFIPALGGWYKRIFSDFPEPEYDEIRDTVAKLLVHKANAPINRKMKQIGADLLGDKQALTGSEAARMLNSSLERISAMVKSQELKGTIIKTSSNEYCMVARSDIDRMRKQAEKFLDGNQVMDVLCIPKRLKDRLVECEILLPVKESDRSKFSKGKFKRKDVMSLIAVLSNYYQPRQCDNFATLLDISRRRLGKGVSELIYQKIFSGEVRACLVLPDKQGLDQFYFDEKDIQDVIDGSKCSIELSIVDMKKLFGHKHSEVMAWINGGYLQARSETVSGKKRYFISLPQLRDFWLAYLPLSKVANKINKLPVHLSNSLGARDLITESAAKESGVNRGFLVDVRKLVRYALEH